jgi:hypothetical protein
MPSSQDENDMKSRRDAMRILGTAASIAALPIGATSALITSAEAADDEYSRGEIIDAVSDFFDVTTGAVASVVEHVFSDLGRPNAYVKGEEGSAAFIVGGIYGSGFLYRKRRSPFKVYWGGPSLGFDIGGNVSRVFTLVYQLRRDEEIFQRFPGVEGTYYFVGGIGVTYQRSGRISLAPMRTGLGLRAGVNVGYQNYTRDRNILPF